MNWLKKYWWIGVVAGTLVGLVTWEFQPPSSHKTCPICGKQSTLSSVGEITSFYRCDERHESRYNRVSGSLLEAR